MQELIANKSVFIIVCVLITSAQFQVNIPLLPGDREKMYNDITDILFEIMRANGKSLGWDKVRIPDFEAEYKTTTLSGAVTLADGTIEGLTNMYRVGDATLYASPSGSILFIGVDVSFKDLAITYEHYHLDTDLFPDRSGAITMKINSNEFRINFHMHQGDGYDHCEMDVSLRVNRLEDVVVQVSQAAPPGDQDPPDALAEWWTWYANSGFVERADDYFRNVATELSADKTACDKLMGSNQSLV